jgi:enoyl-CoA hydratase/carnithine racemase
MAEDLLVELSPPIATLRLNRPQRRNALSMDLMQTLIGALRDISSNKEVKVVIVAGEGPVFSAGHDLSEMVGQDLSDYRRIFDVCTELMTSIQKIPQPVIAQVGGIATAAGCQLVTSCDLAVASQDAQFATPGVLIGLFCSTPMVPLTRAIGRKRSMEMLLTGKPIDARTALEWGLVNRVVPQEELTEATRELAREIAKASSLVLAIGKEAFYAQIELDQPKAYAYTKEVMSTNAAAADGQEGMTAFLEKRPACWTNR